MNKLMPFDLLVKTLSVNYGKEFTEQSRKNIAYKKTYFADLFARWQQGYNKKLNGLLRRYTTNPAPNNRKR